MKFSDWRVARPVYLLLLWSCGGMPAAAQYSISSCPTCPNGVCVSPSWQPVRIEPGSVAREPVGRMSQPAVCRVTNAALGGTNVGSGTLIESTGSRALVLTCAHLFHEGEGKIVVAFTGGRRYGAKLVAIDDVNDLAALSIRDPDIAPAKVSAASLVGRLTACGFGSDGRLACTAGSVTGYATPQGAIHPSACIRGAVRSGDSGGGVFNAQGRLVAVVWGARAGTTYATFGRPLREFIQRVTSPRQEGMVAVKPAAPHTLPAGDDSNQQTVPSAERFTELAARLAAVDGRLRRLETKVEEKPGADLLVTRDQLSEFVRREELGKFAERRELADLHQLSLRQQTTLRGELQQAATRLVESARTVAVATVHERLTERAGWWAGLSTRPMLAGALGVGGPVGLALAVGLYFLFRRQTYDSARFGSGSAKPSRHAGDAGRASPIAVDSPPLPQRTMPETHYVPYERDSFSKAYQWASGQVVRKYPGSVETLNALDSLIKQQVNARE